MHTQTTNYREDLAVAVAVDRFDDLLDFHYPGYRIADTNTAFGQWTARKIDGVTDLLIDSLPINRHL